MVLYVTLYKVVQTHMKAIEQCFHAVQIIRRYTDVRL